jgi:hypothetical protein
MTVEASDTIERYTISGVGPYPFNFRIFHDTDLAVNACTSAAPPVPQLLTYLTHYSVDGTNDADGGTILLTAAAAASYAGQTLDIRSNTPQTQPTSIRNQARFLPEIHEDAFDRLERQVQDLNRRFGLALRLPDNEILNGEVEPAENRKGKYLIWDAVTGAITSALALTTTALTQGVFNTYYSLTDDHKRTAAEIAAGVVPTNYAYLPNVPVIDVRRYGAVLDGVTDDFIALSRALTVAGIVGGRVMIPGHMAVDSINGAATAYLFSCGSNIEIVGLGRQTSSITITGTSTTKLFHFLNQKRFRLADISIIGNSQASSAGDDAALVSWNQDDTATTTGGHVVIERVYFSNCRSSYWVNFTNESATYAVEGIWIDKNIFQSFNGNSINPASSGNPACCISVSGAHTNPNGLYRQVHITRNWAECHYIKQFLFCWSGCDGVWANNNTVVNAGQAGANDNCIAYGFAAYDSSTGAGVAPTNIYFDDNRIIAPRDCGIYTAGPRVFFARRNTISGQTSTVDGSLPKGAIAMNGATVGEIHDNEISDCYNGISLFAYTAGGMLRAHNNSITAVKANGYGIKSAQTTISGNFKELSLLGNTIQTDTTADVAIKLDMRSGATTGSCDNIIVKDNTTLGPFARPIWLFAGDATVPNLVDVDISDNNIGGCGTNAGIDVSGCTNAAQRMSICRNKFKGTWGAAAYMLHLQNAVGLNVLDNEFCDMTTGTGAAIMNAGAQGNLRGNLYTNVSAAFRYYTGGAGGFGMNLPTWATSLNGFVQDLNVTELGAPASKYIRQGWQYDATNAAWKEARCLTGN